MGALFETGMRWPFNGLRMLALLSLLFGCARTTFHGSAPGGTAAALDLDPAVAKLLELKSEAKTIPDVVNLLELLAKKHCWQKQLAECKEFSFFDWDETKAVLIRAGKTDYVIILLKAWTHTIPGSDVQSAILLDNQGKCLDYLACEINSRLTRMHSGQLNAVIADKPESDGAQLMIRLDGQSARGNFAHNIYHRGNKSNFYWGEGDLPENQATKWDNKGLCRVAIKAGQFKVLFPCEKDKGQRRLP